MLQENSPVPPLPQFLLDYPFFSLAPPVLAIGLAIFFRDVNFALIVAVVAGCLLMADFDLMATIERTCDVFVDQVADGEHASVILFTVLLGAMIGLMNDSGGTNAIVSRIARFADNRKKGQVLTWLAGVVVFFDDYANTMLIGGTVRPLTDKLKISRAKLAFLVDATAAPIAGLALSTWTAYEINEVRKGLLEANLAVDATAVFVSTIPYRIYPIVAIIFVGVVAFSGKDFGPMLKAENQTEPQTGEDWADDEASTASMLTAIIPIATLILTVIALLARDYRMDPVDWWKNVDAFRLLLITSLSASTAAVFSAVTFGRMKLTEASESWGRGIASMIPAVIVLILAWAINGVCGSEQLQTASYIISLIGKSVRAEFLPAIAFVTAGGMAVSIGSSFATMGLLLPLFIPLANAVLAETGIDPVQSPVFLAAVGAILAGAIFGDHCSPISDTTVLSSAAAGCDHLQHVATQVPYALVIAVSSLLFGYLPIGFGVPWWIALPLCIAASVGAVLFFGRTPDDAN